MFVKFKDIFGKEFYVNASKVAVISGSEENCTKITNITFESGFSVHTITDTSRVAVAINSRLEKISSKDEQDEKR